MNADAAGSKRRKRVIITIGGGGHRFQSLMLARQLCSKYELVVATTAKWHNEAEAKKMGAVAIYEIPRIRTFTERNPFRSVWNFLRVIAAANRMISESKADAIIAVGTNLSVPLFICGRLRGVHCIFIESITRVDTLSATTRLLKKLRLCNRIFVQWPDLADQEHGILYEGTVL